MNVTNLVVLDKEPDQLSGRVPRCNPEIDQKFTLYFKMWKSLSFKNNDQVFKPVLFHFQFNHNTFDSITIML